MTDDETVRSLNRQLVAMSKDCDELRDLLDRLCRINYAMTPEAAAVISNSVIADYLKIRSRV